MRDYEVLLCKEEIASPDKVRLSRNDIDIGDCFGEAHLLSAKTAGTGAMTLIWEIVSGKRTSYPQKQRVQAQ